VRVERSLESGSGLLIHFVFALKRSKRMSSVTRSDLIILMPVALVLSISKIAIPDVLPIKTRAKLDPRFVLFSGSFQALSSKLSLSACWVGGRTLSDGSCWRLALLLVRDDVSLFECGQAREFM